MVQIPLLKRDEEVTKDGLMPENDGEKKKNLFYLGRVTEGGCSTLSNRSRAEKGR